MLAVHGYECFISPPKSASVLTTYLPVLAALRVEPISPKHGAVVVV